MLERATPALNPNSTGFACVAHTTVVQGLRERAMRAAELLPIFADSGGPRRAR